MSGSARVCILLGAGFSKWAAGLPTAAELFDFAIELFGSRDERNVRLVRDAKETWDAQHPMGSAEQFIAYALAETSHLRISILWYIVRRLSDPYIWLEWHAGRWRRHVLMIDEKRKYETPGVAKARDFLLGLHPKLTGILTTNYDLLVEYALGTRLFNYGRHGEVLTGRGAYPVSQWRNPATLRGTIPLAKMHGSISWDINGRYTDGRRGITGNALIVAPTPEKTSPASLATEWALAGSVLGSSTHVLVFGFAFNPYDEAILNHFSEHGANVKCVILVDKEPKIERATDVWGRATVVPMSPPPDTESEMQDWLSKLHRNLA